MGTEGKSMEPPPEIAELGRFAAEFNSESDRGAVLVAASRIDEILKSVLVAFLRGTNSASELLEGFNALSAFSARASACHALGLIDDAEFADITLIRKIRNAFSHEWKDVHFGNQKIAALVANLPWRGPAEFEEGAKPRSRFGAAVMLLITDLLWRERLVDREKIEHRTWPNTTESRHGK